jgi:transcriptional regulator with XRE-family HTH domain
MPPATLFGSLLRAFRKQAGLSQQTIAVSLHVAPATISKIETGRIKPPEDPAFYERLRAVPGFTASDITLLREAAQADKSSEDLGKLLEQLKANWQSIRKILESRLRNPQSGSSIEVRRQGLAGKNRQDFAQVEAAKADKDLALMLAHHLKDLGGFMASGEQFVWDVAEHLRRIDAELPSELQPIGQAMTQILTEAYAESLTLLSALGLAENTLAMEQATQDPPTPLEEEQESLTKFVHKGIRERGSISSPVKPEIPDHYEHTNVPEHAPRLVGEGKFQEAQARRRTNIVYQSRDAKDKVGQVAPDQLVTVQDVIDTLHLPPSTVWSWFATGRLKERGRVWLAEPGGRGSPLVSKDQAETLKNERPPRGRPPKRKRKG